MGYFGYGRRSEKLTTNIFRTDRPEGKKIKEVYPNHSALCHVWASGSVPRGVAGNMFFEEGIIYSYGFHYKAAKIFDSENAENGKLVLINKERRSTSTGQHLNEIAGAVSHLSVLHVPNVDPADHSENVSYLEKKIFSMIEGIFLLKGGYWEALDVRDATMELNLYLETFKLPGKIDLSSEAFQILEEALEESEKAGKEKQKARREARKVKEKQKEEELKIQCSTRLKELEENFPLALEEWKAGELSNNEFSALTRLSLEVPGPFGRTKRVNLEISEEVIKKHLPEIMATVKARFFETLEAWREGTGTNYAINSRSSIKLGGTWHEAIEENSGLSYLRINGNEVETSNHASVPLEEALRLLKLILNKEAKAGEKVGPFSFIGVKENGKTIVKIGCHNIELNEAVKVLGPLLKRENLKLVN